MIDECVSFDVHFTTKGSVKKIVKSTLSSTKPALWLQSRAVIHCRGNYLDKLHAFTERTVCNVCLNKTFIHILMSQKEGQMQNKIFSFFISQNLSWENC